MLPFSGLNMKQYVSKKHWYSHTCIYDGTTPKTSSDIMTALRISNLMHHGLFRDISSRAKKLSSVNKYAAIQNVRYIIGDGQEILVQYFVSMVSGKSQDVQAYMRSLSVRSAYFPNAFLATIVEYFGTCSSDLHRLQATDRCSLRP
jgi:hypothetical protein